MPLTYTWIDGTTGDWGTAANWSGGVVPDGTTNATIAGTGTETVTVSSNQSVNLLTLDDPNATLSVTGNAYLSAYGGLSASAVHEIDVTQGTLLLGGGSQGIDNTTINLGVWTPSYQLGILTTDPLSQLPAVLTFGPNLTINSAYGQIVSGNASGDGIVNHGTINDTANLSLSGYAITNDGAISGGSGTTLSINGSSSITNDATGIISADNLSFNNGGAFVNQGTISGYSSLYFSSAYNASFANDGTISGGYLSFNQYVGAFDNRGTISGTSVVLSDSVGAFTNEGGITADNVNLTVASAGFTNTGTISGKNLNIYTNYDTFVNSGTIAADVSGGSGSLTHYTFSNSQSFDNEGTIAVSNDDTLYLTLQGGSSGVNNNIISVGSGGHLILNGTLGGSGSMVINDGGLLEAAGGNLSDAVNFAGIGTLQLDAANAFTGTISGLTTGDAIDFAHAAITDAQINGNVLTVTYAGGQTTQFTLTTPIPNGDFVQTTFDGSGGTKVVVTDVPLPPPPTYTWIDGTTGDWGTAANWSGGVVPDGTTNATIAGTGTETVTVSSNQSV
ncbi:beta strand repeat-containing protein, partial [Bradyrhizobium macuxiense]|uniref:beta strand repeat-containing protein n=1 Tax=Bradyrhizobium macuxiense TaxID=1755647 RepID=UPI00142EC94E